MTGPKPKPAPSAVLCRLFAMAEEAYFWAQGNESRENWLRCVVLGEAYVRLGGKWNVHIYLNFALNKIGLVGEALDSCMAGLEIEPGNHFLVTNGKLYSDHLSRDFGPPQHVRLVELNTEDA